MCHGAYVRGAEDNLQESILSDHVGHRVTLGLLGLASRALSPAESFLRQAFYLFIFIVGQGLSLCHPSWPGAAFSVEHIAFHFG